MRYLNSRIRSCYCAPMFWVFAPEGALLLNRRVFLFHALRIAISLLMARTPRTLSLRRKWVFVESA
jgi:hypothetical protein